MTEHEEPTKEELLQEARKLDVEGRSQMDKEELARAVKKEAKAAGLPQHGEPTLLAEWRANEYEGGRPAEDA